MDSFSTFSPFSGALLKSFNYSTWPQIENDILIAEREFQRWRKTSISQRADYLQKLSSVLRRNKAKLAHQINKEMGKSLSEAFAEIEKSTLACDYYAEHGPSFLASQKIKESSYLLSEVSFQPLGVIFSIMPWNFPVWQLVRFAVPAILAGNVVLVKHSDLVAETAELIAEIWTEAFPDFKTLNNIPMTHADAAKVIAHHFVKAVTFTGSSQAGRIVASEAGKNIKKVVLELGGNDAYIICEDADLAHAAKTCARSRLINAGQSCVAGKRFFVDKKVYPQFLSLFMEELESIEISPLAHKKFQSHVQAQVEKMVSFGGRVLVGGFLPDGPGAFYPTTVIECLTPAYEFHQEEIFGPVALVFAMDGIEEGVRMANLSPFGLGGGIFTKDVRFGKSIVEQNMEAGFVVVNDFVKSDPRTPFGGIKESGYGRELGSFGIMEFVNIKTVGVSEVNDGRD
jgi:succinate-semialdehyde dehydrogenase/glutarate-semialdehyde dehydrogenase